MSLPGFLVAGAAPFATMRTVAALFVSGVAIMLAPEVPACAPQEAPAKAAAEAAPAGGTAEARLEADVRWLCAPERKGRGPEVRDAVVGWLEERFRQAELLPLFEGSFRRGFEIDPLVGTALAGINVGGVLPGAGWPDDRSHVVVSAHHDHLGVRRGAMYPGAADNAAGVAAMLEVLRGLGPQRGRLRRSVVFLAFDLEEKGLLGSRAYARAPALPLESMTTFTTMDILGRRVLDRLDRRLVVLGWERSPALLDLAARHGSDAMRPLFVGSDIIGDRSDYAAFRDRRVPFLFFSSGENADYHHPTDTPERLDFPLLAAQAAYVGAVAGELARAEEAPAFQDELARRVEEAASFVEVFGAVAGEESAPAAVRENLAKVRKELEEAVRTKSYGEELRGRVKALARMLMLALRYGR